MTLRRNVNYWIWVCRRTCSRRSSAGLYQKAAAQGVVPAMPALGNLYRHVRGAAPDKAQAMRWYQQAAQRGYRDAAVALREL